LPCAEYIRDTVPEPALDESDTEDESENRQTEAAKAENVKQSSGMQKRRRSEVLEAVDAENVNIVKQSSLS
jgi:hypothetical protein